MKSSILFTIILFFFGTYAAQGLPSQKSPTAKRNLENISTTSKNANTYPHDEKAIGASDSLKISRRLPNDSENRMEERSASKKHLRSKVKNIDRKETSDSIGPQRKLTSIDELFGKPIGQWEIEDWLMIILLFFIFSAIISFFRRCYCCGCDLCDLITCFFCWEICCDPSAGIGYAGGALC